MTTNNILCAEGAGRESTMTPKTISDVTRADGSSVVVTTSATRLRNFFCIKIEDRTGMSEARLDKDEVRALIDELTTYLYE